MSNYRENDCAYVCNNSTKPVELMYNSIIYSVPAKACVPFLGVIAEFFVSKNDKLKLAQINDVVVKPAPAKGPAISTAKADDKDSDEDTSA